MQNLAQVFTLDGLTPHGWCLLWEPGLLALQIGSDAVIGISYYVIPMALAVFVSRRRDLAFGWIFWMFAAFILACGTTHWFEILTVWHPDYWTQGGLKLVTALVSAATAVAVWVLMPRALALPSQSQFKEVTTALNTEVEQRLSVLRALEESEKRFQLLIESVTDSAIFSLDRHGVVRDWNKGAERIKGYKGEEVIGRHFSMFYTPADRDAGVPAYSLEEALRTGRHEAEIVEVRRDGSEFWANSVIEPMHDDSGKLVGFVKITRDISHRRELEERLRQSQKMEAIGQLTGGVAHDFNNLLMVIISSLDRAKSMAQNDVNLHQAVDLALRGADRAAGLTSQLLAFARRQPLDPREIDVGRLVVQMTGLLDRTLGERIKVETVRAAGLWQAFCDGAQLESVILNLAVNARDAMPQGGTLTLEVSNAFLDDEYVLSQPDVLPGQYVLVAVTDSGSGMAPQVMERAFEPFYTTKPPGVGTGLGLSQVFGFVKQSGGHVSLYSEPGHGTTIKLYLPRSTMPSQTGATPAVLPEPGKGRGELILVVEDDSDVRLAVVTMLRELGYRVLDADGPEQGLRLLREHQVDLIFTDVVMPGPITTREFADQAREMQPRIRVLFTSGYTQNAIVHGGRLDTGVELLSKPYRREQLARRIERLLKDRDPS